MYHSTKTFYSFVDLAGGRAHILAHNTLCSHQVLQNMSIFEIYGHA